jgi:predicted N-acyltransferase
MTRSVRFVHSAAEIDAALWQACFPPPLEGRWWYEVLERSGLEDQFAFLYGVIERDGVAVGIAPAFLMEFPLSLVAPAALQPVVRRLGRFAYPRTLFVGSPCADEGTVGLLPGVDRNEALLALQKALRTHARAHGASLLVWKDFPPATAPDLKGLFPVVSFPGTVVEFSSPRKEDYFARLKSSRRHILRKKLRRSAALAELRTEVVHRPQEQALDEMFGLFMQTYERAETRFEKLNRRFFALIAEQPMAHFIVLKEPASGAMVAFMLCFELGPKVINKFIGIDYRRPKEWLLYFRLWDAAVDWALARGAQSIQSGQTGYAPKIETGHQLVPLVNYCMHRNFVVHAVAKACARRIDWSSLDDALARHVRAHPEALPGQRTRSQTCERPKSEIPT